MSPKKPPTKQVPNVLGDVQAKKKAEVVCNKLREILPKSFVPKPFYIKDVTFIRIADHKLVDIPPTWGIRISVEGCDYYPTGQGGCISLLDIKMTKKLTVQEVVDKIMSSLVELSLQEGSFKVKKRFRANLEILLHRLL